MVIPLAREEIDLTCTTGRPTGITAPLGLGAEFGLLRPYSQRQELEADRLGPLAMAQTGYEPPAAVTLWRRTERLGGRQRGPAVPLTHPAPGERIAALERELPEARARTRTAR